MISATARGSLIASFFLVGIFFSGVVQSVDASSIKQNDPALFDTIAQDPLWLVILRIKNGQPVSRDYSLYLSQSPVRSVREVKKTLALFESDPKSICQFPARLALLKKYIPSLKKIDPLKICPQYASFIKNVPAETVNLIYASENVTSASSMMGHIMLRLDGNNSRDIFVQHGITFFTELGSLNVPKIMYDTLVTGKEGVFRVAPYHDFESHYVHSEQRNIWRYELNFSPSQTQMLLDVIWEIGQQNPKYFFHTFNCATVTQILITIAQPELFGSVANWLTPLDVVRFATTHDLVKSTQFKPSNRWSLAALSKNINRKSVTNISQGLKNTNLKTEDLSFIDLTYSEHLNRYLYQKGRLSESDYAANNKEIAVSNKKFEGFSLDVSDIPAPSSRGKEGYLGVGLSQIENENYLLFRAFPVAKRLSDDNRSMVGETELILSDIALRLGVDQHNMGTLYLDNLKLYQMVSRVPLVENVFHFSSRFNVGATRVLSKNFEQELVGQIEFGLGLTKEFKHSVGLYSDVIVGVGADKTEQYAYVQPVVGGYFYTQLDSKVMLEYGHIFNQYDHDEPIQKLEINYAQYGLQNLSLDFNIELQYVDKELFSSAGFMVAYRF